MPHHIDWLDPTRRLLAVRLLDPLPDHEIEQLRTGLEPIAQVQEPLYVLLDVRRCDMVKMLSRALSALDGSAWPAMYHHLQHSRLAILGGGPTATLIISLAARAGSQADLLRAFDDEAQALAWLRQQSDHAHQAPLDP